MNLARLITLFLVMAFGAFAEPTSVHYRYGTWKKQDIVVCFGDASLFEVTDFPRSLTKDHDSTARAVTPDRIGSFPEKWRSFLRDLIKREYSRERTGIHFVGWKNCRKNAAGADVVLFLSRDDFKASWTGGWAAVGRNLDIDAGKEQNNVIHPEKKGFVYLAHPDSRHEDMYGFPYQTKAEETFALNAIHEFGHIAGLAHEQERIFKGQEDSNCLFTLASYPTRREQPDPDGLGENIRATGDYDPDSIMNYCRTRMMETVTGTSYIEDPSLPAFAPGPGYEYACKLTAETFKVADRPKKTESNALPSNAVHYVDPSLVSKTPLTGGRVRYDLRIGLSQGDLHVLRCIYKFDVENAKRRCVSRTLWSPEAR